jgi:glycosyltransferase involved in cell wall biosynthesis
MDVDSMHSGEKNDVVVYVGSLTSHKGVMDALDWGEENDIGIYVYGVGECIEQVLEHPYAYYCGTVNYEELLEVYSVAKRFIFLPNWVDPFARTTVEARLSGCELITNEKVGAMSYEWWDTPDYEYREILKCRANRFWDILELL